MTPNTDDVAGLVAKLRAIDHGSVEDCFMQSPLFDEAADFLESQAKALREAEVGIKAWMQLWSTANYRALAAEARLKEAEKVIAWYADPHNYTIEISGCRARAFLNSGIK